MVNLFTGEAADDFFGGEIPSSVRALIDQARQTTQPEQARSLLWAAQLCAPRSLAIYYLLYKFHARYTEFEQAQQAALKGLAMAAEQAGLPQDWQLVLPKQADFLTPGPARFWLFTLKALAFIRLRQHDPKQARAYLTKVQQLDPQGGSGGAVIAALLRASEATDSAQPDLPN